MNRIDLALRPRHGLVSTAPARRCRLTSRRARIGPTVARHGSAGRPCVALTTSHVASALADSLRSTASAASLRLRRRIEHVRADVTRRARASRWLASTPRAVLEYVDESAGSHEQARRRRSRRRGSSTVRFDDSVSDRQRFCAHAGGTPPFGCHSFCMPLATHSRGTRVLHRAYWTGCGRRSRPRGDSGRESICRGELNATADLADVRDSAMPSRGVQRGSRRALMRQTSSSTPQHARSDRAEVRWPPSCQLGRQLMAAPGRVAVTVRPLFKARCARPPWDRSTQCGAQRERRGRAHGSSILLTSEPLQSEICERPVHPSRRPWSDRRSRRCGSSRKRTSRSRIEARRSCCSHSQRSSVAIGAIWLQGSCRSWGSRCARCQALPALVARALPATEQRWITLLR